MAEPCQRVPIQIFEGENFVKALLPHRSGWRGPFRPFNESRFNKPEQPVVCVCFSDCQHYVELINDQEVDPSRETLLPFPNVWDFAAFGTEFPDHNPTTWLEVQRVIHDGAEFPAPIDHTGERSNALGISDMIGNVLGMVPRPRAEV